MAPLLSRLGSSNFGFGKKKGGAPVPFSATGGNVSALAPGNGYKYHTFTGPGTFTVSGGPGTIEVLLVGGGGSGMSYGGGGGGGIVYVTSYSLAAGSYPITVGSGGVPAYPVVPTNNGQPTTFGSIITADGGGASFNDPSGYGSGTPGASGGGGAGPGNPGGSSVNPGNTAGGTFYGNAGGAGYSRASGGGGGGAGAAGSPSGPGGNGAQFPAFTGPLIGVPSLGPLSGYFGGGGAGGISESSTILPGGLGGGGNSAAYGASPGASTSGITNSGGGGGGAATQSGVGTKAGSPGGSGIAIIRYLA
jgi:hypothetical protein